MNKILYDLVRINLVMSKIIHDNTQLNTDFGEGIKAYYFPDYINGDNYDIISNILESHPFTQVSYTKFNKIRHTPRMTYCYGRFNDQTTASYKGVSFDTQVLPEWLEELKSPIDTYLGCKFNAVIMNKYINGSNNIAWHQDDETFLQHKMIASITMGQERPFQFRVSADSPIHEITLKSGSLFIFDEGLSHCIPKRAHIDGIRYNITFRQVKNNLGIGNYYYYNRRC